MPARITKACHLDKLWRASAHYPVADNLISSLLDIK